MAIPAKVIKPSDAGSGMYFSIRYASTAWRSAILFVGLAIQAQVAVVLPAIATTAFMVLQGR